MGSACIDALAKGGRLLLYSSLSGQPLRIEPRSLMTADRRVEGFWLSVWVKRQNPLRMLGLFRQIKALMAEGIATTDVGATYGLDQIGDAVRHADRPGRGGKVLLRIGSR